MSLSSSTALTQDYNDIQHKGGLSHVRERPGMYVGDFIENTYNSALMN